VPQPLDENLCWLLSRATQALTAEMAEALQELEISPRAHAVLTAALTGEHSQTALARKVGLDKTTMVVTMDELERAGLAERRPSPTDRRARVIAVTAAGRKVVDRGDAVLDRIKDDVLGVLPEKQRAAFFASLQRLVADRLAPEDPTAFVPPPPPSRRRPRTPA
jgi:MarR family transcriptional regulator, transcriptional regulator for hemolysin